MSAFPEPAPLGVSLGGRTHGDAVTFPEALELAGLADFPEDWAIVPDETGEGLRLMWGDACTTEELERSCHWNVEALAYLKASRTPSGTA